MSSHDNSTSSGSESADDSGDSEVNNEFEQNGKTIYAHRRQSKSNKDHKKAPNIPEISQNNLKLSSAHNSAIHVNYGSCRTDNTDPNTTRNASNFARSPKLDEKHIKIKRENPKTEFPNIEHNTSNRSVKSPKTIFDDKSFGKLNQNGEMKNQSANIKREYEKIKLENGNGDGSKLLGTEDLITTNRKKRASSANSSPYKDKKRKKMFDEVANDQNLLPPTNHDRIEPDILPPPPQKPLITKVYYSYFERTNDDRDEIREMK